MEKRTTLASDFDTLLKWIVAVRFSYLMEKHQKDVFAHNFVICWEILKIIYHQIQ